MHDASRDKLDFSYRQLQLKEGTFKDSIIIETVLRLQPGRQKEIIMQCRKYLDRRRAKQPMGVASAGSFFKNPPGDSAGRLIDDAGLKGLRKGNAMVSAAGPAGGAIHCRGQGAATFEDHSAPCGSCCSGDSEKISPEKDSCCHQDFSGLAHSG